MHQRRLYWLAIGFGLAIAMAQIAVWLQRAGFSPLVAFPLLVGFTLGGGIGLAAAYFNETSRRAVMVAAIAGAMICAVAEHGFFYLSYRNNALAKIQADPKAAMAAALNPDQFQPAGFGEYMRIEADRNWRLWIFDAAAMIGAAGVAAWLVTKPRPIANAAAESTLG